jgi:hypothetical protein
VSYVTNLSPSKSSLKERVSLNALATGGKERSLTNKRRNKMLTIKNSKPVFYGLIVASTLAMGTTQACSVTGAASTGPADESQASDMKNGIISKTPYVPGSTCHQQFHSISRSTLGTDHPQLSQSGDSVDYYGPCGYDPAGSDQVQKQILDERPH